ncbi:MAG: glycosyltransferase family 4 protein [Patescibacteria group bacterium]|jgi:glycosyltransferase involved in cell wall biosynthesis
MKIAMIGQKGIPSIYGGIEKHVEELSIRLAAAGNEITAYTRPYYTPKDKKFYKSVKLISLPSIHTKHLDAISHTFIATLHALWNDNDIIHYHGVGPSLLAFIPRILKPRVKVFATFHCLDRQHQKWGRFARFMLWLGEKATCTFAHQVIAVSKTIKDYCYESYQRDAQYIPNGVTAMQNVKPGIIENKFGLKGDDYIVVVSRLIPHKGIHYLIAAYQQLFTDKKLVIVGDSYFTDNYVRRLKNLAKGDKNIIFTGFQTGDTLAELFSNAYLYVQPSESEGLPISVLEAAAYGKCVLASDIPANLEIVRECGLSFGNKNIQELTEKLNFLLKHPEEVDKTGKYARKYVLEHYNWEDIVKQTQNTYQKVLKEEVKESEYLPELN